MPRGRSPGGAPPPGGEEAGRPPEWNDRDVPATGMEGGEGAQGQGIQPDPAEGARNVWDRPDPDLPRRDRPRAVRREDPDR